MLGLDHEDVGSFSEDMITVVGRLPLQEECRRIRHLNLQHSHVNVVDDELAKVLAACPHLETVVLSGVPDATDRTIVLLSGKANNLRGVDLSGCHHVTDVGVLEIVAKSLPLQWIRLNGLDSLTDMSISALVRSCPRILELELCDLPLLSPLPLRDIWSFSRTLCTLRLARCPLLTSKAFPSALASTPSISDSGSEKPLPPRPTTWLEGLSPLILRHKAENLRVLDLASCKITDDIIEGIVMHAPKIQTLILSGCSLLTDRALDSICLLGDHLDVLMLAHVAHITDRAVVKLARTCFNLRCVDVAFCRNLTDMAVFELAGLAGLRRLSLVRVHKLTDIAIFALADYATALERLHLSYCDRLSLEAMHLLLRKLDRLQHVTATGIPSFRRKGIHRFSESPPPNLDLDQQAAFRVFSGENVVRLRKFLDREDQRRQEAELQNIPFVSRSDDRLDLY